MSSYKTPLALKLEELDGYKCDLSDARTAVQVARAKRAETRGALQKLNILPEVSHEYASAEVEYQKARVVYSQAQGRVDKAKAEVRALRRG